MGVAIGSQRTRAVRGGIVVETTSMIANGTERPMGTLAKRRRELTEALMNEAICEAAAKVLAEQGLAVLTMDRVAQAAEVSKGTLYNYFRDKEALLVAVAEWAFDPLKEALARVIAETPDPAQAIEQATLELFRGVDERRDLGQVLCASEHIPALAEQFRGNALWLRDQYLAAFERVAAAGRLTVDETPFHLARTFAIAVHGFLDERILHGEECPPLAEEMARIRHLFLDCWIAAH